jgi:hypothetical protein
MPTDPPPTNDNLLAIDTLFRSPAFATDAVDDQNWRTAFVELISRVDKLLTQVDEQGQRVDFTKGIGVHGKIQDITSLVHWMNQHLPDVAADRPGQWPQNRLNRYTNEGWGRFANGCSFANEFDGDTAFFIDDQRIYLRNQLHRAVDQAKQRLVI